MKRFRLSTLAEADLDEIWLYVAGDRSVDVANRLIDDILDGIVLLASHPKAGRLRNEIAPGLRSFPAYCTAAAIRQRPAKSDQRSALAEAVNNP